MDWASHADNAKICQMTHPDRVHGFINSFSGLDELCHEYPGHLCCYAPQLSIPEFSGPFSRDFDDALRDSISQSERQSSGSNFGTALTLDGMSPLCEREWTLRHPTFGNYKPEFVASFFVHGELFAPHTRYFEDVDVVIWLLTTDSDWLPSKQRDVLVSGAGALSIWTASYNLWENAFVNRLFTARSAKTFQMTKGLRSALEDIIAESLSRLELCDSPSQVADLFLERGFIETHFAIKEQRGRS
jgi:hypothetical protein